MFTFACRLRASRPEEKFSLHHHLHNITSRNVPGTLTATRSLAFSSACPNSASQLRALRSQEMPPLRSLSSRHQSLHATSQTHRLRDMHRLQVLVINSAWQRRVPQTQEIFPLHCLHGITSRHVPHKTPSYGPVFRLIQRHVMATLHASSLQLWLADLVSSLTRGSPPKWITDLQFKPQFSPHGGDTQLSCTSGHCKMAYTSVSCPSLNREPVLALDVRLMSYE